MSEYKQVIKKLIESEITGYQIYKNTLINQAIISTLRNGKRDLDNLSLKNAEKLYQYGKTHRPRYASRHIHQDKGYRSDQPGNKPAAWLIVAT